LVKHHMRIICFPKVSKHPAHMLRLARASDMENCPQLLIGSLVGESVDRTSRAPRRSACPRKTRFSCFLWRRLINTRDSGQSESIDSTQSESPILSILTCTSVFSQHLTKPVRRINQLIDALAMMRLCDHCPAFLD